MNLLITVLFPVAAHRRKGVQGGASDDDMYIDENNKNNQPYIKQTPKPNDGSPSSAPKHTTSSVCLVMLLSLYVWINGWNVDPVVLVTFTVCIVDSYIYSLLDMF